MPHCPPTPRCRPGSASAATGRGLTEFLILGAGFTAGRVARRLVAEGADVTVTNRQRQEIPGARCLAWDVTAAASLRELRPFVSDGTVILDSIPTLAGTPELVDFIRPLRPARIVYLSSTGVYGAADVVDEHTLPSPQADKDRQRMQAERAVSEGPWSTMVLRPAAIYGPRRGVHWSVRQGTWRPASGNPVVSRIHVDDLAEHAIRALRSERPVPFRWRTRSPVPPRRSRNGRLPTWVSPSWRAPRRNPRAGGG